MSQARGAKEVSELTSLTAKNLAKLHAVRARKMAGKSWDFAALETEKRRPRQNDVLNI